MDGGRLENDEAVDGEELPQEGTLIVSLEDPRCERMAFEEWVGYAGAQQTCLRGD